eukprot:CAMPEP_0194060254 /NCGR_PEP_ID=MMETSP0009_2-20130614/71292_1 /TAXON_ID=210454 /ORGANISM="Grammatophora oceanica, Strain CCMP 410" /LENGTH=230 /DNA_ID=CAMNT_0038711111 /DNA_START=192 /DNA_END=884 /DNA_ORIENTATION=-
MTENGHKDDQNNKPSSSPNPGYVFVTGKVTDPQKFGPNYAAKIPATLVPFGGTFLFKCMVPSVAYNEVANFENAVCLKFPSVQHALDWETSADYDALKPIRDETSDLNAFVILEGGNKAVANKSSDSDEKSKKGYLIATAKVTNGELLKKEYSSKVGATIEAFGGTFVVKGAAKTAAFNKQTGDPFDMVAIIEFPSVDKAIEWHSSDEYQALVDARNKATDALSFLVFEG